MFGISVASAVMSTCLTLILDNVNFIKRIACQLSSKARQNPADVKYISYVSLRICQQPLTFLNVLTFKQSTARIMNLCALCKFRAPVKLTAGRY